MNDNYDFAFSFAGEDRQIVEAVKNGLQEYRIFYDNSLRSDLCGKDLYNYLRDLYKNKCKYVVCFISKYYKDKIWTNLEFSAIKERLMSTFFVSDFLIPIVIDKNEILPDIPSFIGYYQFSNISDTIKLLKEKYNNSLNEDFYIDNIKNFRNYVLHEAINKIKNKGLFVENIEGKITISYNFGQKIFYLIPENFSNIPCLLLHEEEKSNPPTAIITWKREKMLTFSWTSFTMLSNGHDEGLAINDLIEKITQYFINDWG